MTNLELYRRYVNEIKQYAADNGMSASETNKIFEQCFRKLDIKFTTKRPAIKNPLRIITRLLSTIVVLLFCTLVFYNHPTTRTFVLRNLQNFIYPGLKVFRKLAVPIAKQYPSLTGLYDEWCLVENPYFRVAEMDCRPCASVRSIPDLGNCNISDSSNIGMPYTRAESVGGIVTFNSLVQMYQRNKKIFDTDATTILSNDISYRTIGDVFEKRNDAHRCPRRDIRVMWRITRMKPGRLIRKLFPRPANVPDYWSQSTERFVFIDEQNAPAYSLPNPECSNVVLRCTSGSRLINMVPSSECLQSCQSFTILLSARYTLWFNWWYWRPRSISAINSTEIAISYLTSFC